MQRAAGGRSWASGGRQQKLTEMECHLVQYGPEYALSDPISGDQAAPLLPAKRDVRQSQWGWGLIVDRADKHLDQPDQPLFPNPFQAGLGSPTWAIGPTCFERQKSSGEASAKRSWQYRYRIRIAAKSKQGMVEESVQTPCGPALTSRNGEKESAIGRLMERVAGNPGDQLQTRGDPGFG